MGLRGSTPQQQTLFNNKVMVMLMMLMVMAVAMVTVMVMLLVW